MGGFHLILYEASDSHSALSDLLYSPWLVVPHQQFHGSSRQGLGLCDLWQSNFNHEQFS